MNIKKGSYTYDVKDFGNNIPVVYLVRYSKDKDDTCDTFDNIQQIRSLAEKDKVGFLISKEVTNSKKMTSMMSFYKDEILGSVITDVEVVNGRIYFVTENGMSHMIAKKEVNYRYDANFKNK